MGVENRSSQYDLSADPDLQELFVVWARKIGLAIRTATVGTVVTYNPTTQEATIRVDHLEVKRVTVQVVPGEDPNETNETRVSAPIQLTNVPVFVYGAGDGASYLSFPITPGCTGMLAVLDRSRDTWANRTASVPVDPVKSAIHSLADCVFFPGLTPRMDRITPPTSLTAAVLEAPAIKLGANATPTDTLIKSALLDALDALANAVPVPNDGGAAIQAAFKAVYLPLVATLATVKVTAE
jgi:hypothetical protein